MFDLPYVFGIKKRDWETGEIKGLDVSGMAELIKDRKILIVDDISSRGGANWDEVYKMIEEIFSNCDVELWRLGKERRD